MKISEILEKLENTIDSIENTECEINKKHILKIQTNIENLVRWHHVLIKEYFDNEKELLESEEINELRNSLVEAQENEILAKQLYIESEKKYRELSDLYQKSLRN